MAPENKLLIQDLSARLSYGVKVYAGENLAMTLRQIDYEGFCEAWENKGFQCHSRWMCPYLRSLSSITEEEKKEYEHITAGIEVENGVRIPNVNQIDWLNKNMFDYRGLIEKGLALKAPDSMYETNKK